MSILRQGENVLYFPAETPKVDVAPLAGLRPFPGTFWAVMDPPRDKTAGGVLLHSHEDGWSQNLLDANTQKREEEWLAKQREAEAAIAIYRSDPRSKSAKMRAYMKAEIAMRAYEIWQEALEIHDRSPGAALETRADCATVAASAADIPFHCGDRVMVAPYAAHILRDLFGVKDVAVIGIEDPWADVVPMVWNPVESAWEPTANWILVMLAEKERSVATSRRQFHNRGAVLLAGPEAESRPGDELALSRDRTIHRPDNTKWFAVKYSPWDGMGAVLVRETDSSGVRRVLGVYGDAAPC